MYRKYIKRPTDFVLSLFMIIFLSPVLVIVSVLVWVKMGAPVIFSQKRPGYNGKIFKIYKFRTMSNDCGSDDNISPDGERVTELGRILRKTSLDELPELFNILKGEMSFVGPRPLLEEYLPLYNGFQAQRHTVRPGLTGLAQINGRNSIEWTDRFNYDIKYVNNITFMGDLKILLLTVWKAFITHEGITNGLCETVKPFRGSDNNG